MYKAITPMDKYKQLYMKFGREIDISINVKTKIQCDNLCQNLIETEKLIPSTWASTTLILYKRKYHKGNGELGR